MRVFATCRVCGERLSATDVNVRSPLHELTVSDEVWNLAVRRAAVIGPLASSGVVGAAAADAAAAELGVSRRQVYVMLRRWRDGEGVVSDLLPGKSSGGRGRGHLPDDLEALIREVLYE